jgi:hypothetical protein
MKIADLDMETRRLIVTAHIAVKRPNDSTLAMLRSAVEAFDAKHDDERTDNVLRAIFGEIPTGGGLGDGNAKPPGVG